MMHRCMMLSYGADFGEGVRELFMDGCGRCERSERNIDNRPMVVTCWIVFVICCLIFVITLPFIITQGKITNANRISFWVFYGIVGFFLLVSTLSNMISCYSLCRLRSNSETHYTDIV